MIIMRAKLISFFKNTPFFWLLIPVFFILKNTVIYFKVIPATEIIWLAAEYIAGAILFYLTTKKIFNQPYYKAALYSALFLSVYFFSDAFSSFILKLNAIQPFNRYRYAFILLMILVILACFRIRSIKSIPQKLIVFLNLLLIIFCMQEGGKLVNHLVKDKNPLLNPGPALPFNYAAAAQAKHPNIYFLLFDEYLGNKFLQKNYNYDNKKLKSFLTKNDFFIPGLSRSNYNYTPVSMASILNMNYLEGKTIKENIATVDGAMGIAAGNLIKKANAINFLRKNNYRIVNLSQFQIDKAPEIITSYNTIPTKREIISQQTFFNLILRKFGWYIDNEKWLDLIHFDMHDHKHYNHDTKEELIRKSRPDSNISPQFVYAHFYMPHFPFLKDSLGRDINLKYLMKLITDIDTKNSNNNTYKLAHDLYLSYIKYTNIVLMDMVDKVIKNDPNAILMIMSDHGLRMEAQEMIFNNQFYIRIPGSDYSNWPDTVDAVNAFRLLFNNEFNQKLDYLPYRSIRVVER